MDGQQGELGHGAVVIAAITSCTNTSNPSVMLGAGILARKAVARGLRVRPWVKTSLAPGSKVVTRYLEDAGLLRDSSARLPRGRLRLHDLHRATVARSPTGCRGGQERRARGRRRALRNRNFEGRINASSAPTTWPRRHWSSPSRSPAPCTSTRSTIPRTDPQGRPVFLRDVWPSPRRSAPPCRRSGRASFARSTDGSRKGRALALAAGPEGELYAWDATSTYIKSPPFFEGMSARPKPLTDIRGARVLALLGDSITTDHISPAGSIPSDSPAGRY